MQWSMLSKDAGKKLPVVPTQPPDDEGCTLDVLWGAVLRSKDACGVMHIIIY